MPPPRVDQRDPAHPKYGKPGVTYPYGDLRFPRIVEAYTASKTGTRRERAFLSPHPDKVTYPGALLISQQTDKGGDIDQNITAVYETLPGPIFVDVTGYRDTGIPMLVSKQKVAATANYATGEFQPAAVNVASIADNGDGTCTVTLSAAHDLPPKCWVTFSGTNSTPNINGNRQIISVPSPTQVIIPVTISGAGTVAGTMQAINRIVRELKPVPDNASMMVKIDTMVGVPGTSSLPARNVSTITNNGNGTCTVTLSAAHGMTAGLWAMFSGTNSTPKIDGPRKILSAGTNTVVLEVTITGAGTAAGTMTPMGDLSAFNEDFKCWKDYDFPDFLTGINFYREAATTSGFSFNSHVSWGGAVGLPMQDGYRGPCRARRLRLFFVGAPPDSLETNLVPTFIMPSSGTFVIQGGSKSEVFTPDLINSTFSNSVSYRTGRIPHCLTGPTPSTSAVGIVTTGGIGVGLASLEVNLPESVPTHFTAGDIITLMGQPTKYDAGALWEVIVYLITVPYTSGSPPP